MSPRKATPKPAAKTQAEQAKKDQATEARILAAEQEKADKAAKDKADKEEARIKAIQEAREQGFVGGLVIHCSASNLKKHDNAATIDLWHKRRGWKGIGYHWFIRSDGKLETGRPIDSDPYLDADEMGAHVLGENRNYFGVCLHGLQATDFTPAQFITLAKLIENEILSKNEDAEILGHNYFTDKKTCPNFDWKAWVKLHFPKNYPVEKS